MQGVNHAGWIGIVIGVKFHGVPPELSPVLPVLHHNVDRNVALAEAGRGFEKLVLTGIALAALPESVSPLGEHGRDPRRVAILFDHFI